MVLSGKGPQQGEPIGPLLFSNTIHPTLSSLKSCLNLRYLDDITLGGSAKTVAADIREIIRAGAAIGLSLNVDKCELITHRDFQVNDALVQSFKRVELEDATLLGAPLFVGAALDSAWENHCEDLARACDRLRLIRRVSSLALSAIVASAASTLSLQSDILSGCVSSDCLTTIFFSQSLGRPSSAIFLRSCLLNSHFGIALACWRTRELWSHR